MESLNFFIYRLKHAKGIGNQGLLNIVAQSLKQGHHQFSMGELLFYGNVSTQYRESFQESYEKTCEQGGCLHQAYSKTGFLTITDDAYPTYLRESYNPPVAFFYRGNLNHLNSEIVAIVGARAMTDYGRQAVNVLVPPLVKAGMTVISGLAKGIDTCAHQQVIRHQGQTIAVIGSGLDYSYPRENQRLQEYIAVNHLLISEYPPSTKPYPHHFPARNRLIAGIAKGTCIIEAKQKSGSLITAQLALDGGRDVFAVPGSILTDHSAGCHDLIQQGAKCVMTGADIIEEYQLRREFLMN